MGNDDQKRTERELAELVRKTCIEAARDGFKDASISGLCTEGAMEAAISSIQRLDLERIIQKK
ncbi:acetyltransferase [Aliifodinibius salipaludis]|uniref:Acetyltransferase n=1 Tax=Fodinibius salipaludis TaxID=2032627 RepID=A0A2A2G8D3_9BACT|nr:acetyltransferase [Aliifodinibius salipaludis]PAU93264.1 acetyltransferase [Aliifodinibius salipaludis]